MYHLVFRLFCGGIEYEFTDIKQAVNFINITDDEIAPVVDIICIGIVPQKYLFNPYATDKKMITICKSYLLYNANDLYYCKSLFENHLRKVGIYL